MTNETETETGTALALFPKLNLPSVTGITEEMNASFKTMYTRLEEDIAKLPTDMSDPKNRAIRASYAYRISTTKTALDEAAKSVASDAKKIVHAVNVERSQLRENLDSLRDTAKGPVDDWRDQERAKEQRAETESRYLDEVARDNALMTSGEVYGLFAKIDKSYSKEEFGDAAHDLIAKRERTRTELTAIWERRKAEEEQAAELEQLRREKAEREAAEEQRRLDEERIEQERIAEQRRQEEEQQRIENERIERERIAKEAEEKAAKDAAEKIAAEQKAREDAEKRAEEAEAREKQRAEDEKRREIEQAEAQKEAAARAEEDAKRREEAAKEEERQRLAKLAAEKEQADRERAADIAHTKKINGEALAALMATVAGLTEKQGQAVIIAIYKGQVPHVAISY